MIYTDNYIRYSRVDTVAETATGVEAELHRERLRIDVVRDDVVRIKISRGGEFDETPTYAVCVDPLADVPHFDVVRDEERVQVTTAACTVSLWLDPFRSTCTAPTGRRWWRRRRTRRAATGRTPP